MKGAMDGNRTDIDDRIGTMSDIGPNSNHLAKQPPVTFAPASNSRDSAEFYAERPGNAGFRPHKVMDLGLPEKEWWWSESLMKRRIRFEI